MNRNEGLVQRKNVLSKNDVSPAKIDGHDADEEQFDDDESKETRLTLMEEILLLGLKDREVSIIVRYLKIYFMWNLVELGAFNYAAWQQCVSKFNLRLGRRT